MHLLHSLIISYALDAYLFKLYCYIITLTNKGVKKMNDKDIKDLISTLKEINSNLKIMSLIVIKESGISKDTFNAIEKNKPFYLKVYDLLK